MVRSALVCRSLCALQLPAILFLTIIFGYNANAADLILQREAADSFVFDRDSQNNLPTTLKLSPFHAPTNEYRRFEDMSKADRRIALSQVAIGLIGKTVDNGVARAMLALTDPVRDLGDGLSCKQRFSTGSYRLLCRLKF